MEEEQLVRPRTLDTVQYVKERIEQIAELLEVVDNGALKPGEVTSGPRTVFQRLPRHMRRRAMSHNIKRLPRVARKLAAKYAATAALHRHKPPSRKWRRRPTRLLKRLQRLRRHNIWLETHIWHAKRFRMADVWGWRLPLRSFQRGFRPTYREATAGGSVAAVAFDLSYLCCTQVRPRPGGMAAVATAEAAIQALAPLCATRVSPTFALLAARRDGGENGALLFRPGSYPHGFLGPVRFSWTIQSESATNWSLQIWSHPSAHSAILKSIVELLSAKLLVTEPKKATSSSSNTKTEKDTHIKIRSSDKEMAAEKTTKEASAKETSDVSNKLAKMASKAKGKQSARPAALKRRADQKANRPAEYAADREGIGRLPTAYESDAWRVSDLRHELVRLRLVGPTTFGLLARALHPVTDDELSAAGLYGEFRECHEFWRENFCGGGSTVQPGNLQDGATIALLVEDPRLFRGRLPSHYSSKKVDRASCVLSTPPPPTHVFWDIDFRRRQIGRRWSNARLEKARAENSLAGLRSTPCKIPILLVVHKTLPVGGLPSSACQNQVDVVTPAETGLDFWLAVQFGGGRAAGLTDQTHLAFEGGALSFPADCADSPAGANYAAMDAVAARSRHLKRPRNRRLKYEGRLRVKYPFTFEWPELIADWRRPEDSPASDFFVLRDKAVLARLHVWFTAGGRNKKKKLSGVPNNEEISELLHRNANALVAVRLMQTRRGRVKRLATICLPTDEDLRRLRADPTAVIEEPKPTPISIAKNEKLESEDSHDDDKEEGEELTALPSEVRSTRLEEFIGMDHNGEQLEVAVKPTYDRILKLTDLFPDEDEIALRRKRDKKIKRKALSKCRKAEAQRAVAASICGETPAEPSKLVTVPSYRESSSRPVVGRVVRGDFSFVRSRGCAFGYCPLSVLSLLRYHKKILLRNTTSKFYHLADVSLMAFPSAVW